MAAPWRDVLGRCAVYAAVAAFVVVFWSVTIPLLWWAVTSGWWPILLADPLLIAFAVLSLMDSHRHPPR